MSGSAEETRKRLCTICARGGSKGVPGKNTRVLAGRPLIAHSIQHALDSGLFDRIAVSSDDEDILAVSKAAGADLLIRRPDVLASDTADKLGAIRHAVETSEDLTGTRFDVMVDLDTTSPLRTADDILGAVTMLEREGWGNVLTAMPARRSPYFNQIERHPDGRLAPAKPLPAALHRRQDAPETFDMNASIYVWRRDRFFEGPTLFEADTGLWIMPLDRSWDIDEPMDFEIVSFLMERRGSDVPGGGQG